MAGWQAVATIKFIESKVKRQLKQQVMQCHGGKTEGGKWKMGRGKGEKGAMMSCRVSVT